MDSYRMLVGVTIQLRLVCEDLELLIRVPAFEPIADFEACRRRLCVHVQVYSVQLLGLGHFDGKRAVPNLLAVFQLY